MIGGEGDEARTEQRVRARGEDFDAIVKAGRGSTVPFEAHLQAFRPADPVRLHGADLLGPAFQLLDFFQQVFGILGDPEEPLRQLALFHQCTRAPAAPVDHLLIGEDRVVHRVPVHLGGLAIDKALGEHLQEQGLLGAVIFRVAGRELPAPVQRQAELGELGLHRGDVLIGPLAGMDLLFHRGILGRHTERVPAHRMQHVVAIGAAVTGHDIAHRIVADMAHVQASGRVRKHLQHVGLRRIAGLFGGFGLEQLCLIPGITPFLFRGLRIVPGGHWPLP